MRPGTLVRTPGHPLAVVLSSYGSGVSARAELFAPGSSPGGGSVFSLPAAQCERVGGLALLRRRGGRAVYAVRLAGGEREAELPAGEPGAERRAACWLAASGRASLP